MSYEYSSSSQNFTFPNPLRQHKYFVAAASAMSGLTGLIILFQARTALHDGARARALVAAAVAFLLIVVAGGLLFQFFSQLRFFFGRGRPMGLAPQLGPDQLGTSQGAETYIKETLRQQALEYPEPADPLSSLLYYLIPDLIYAPRPVRGFAEKQFQSGLVILALLAGLVVSAVLGSGRSDNAANLSSWVAIVLFLVAIPTLWRPKAGTPNTDAGLSALSVPKMAGLIAFSVLGPVVISLLGSALPAPPISISTGTLFLLLLMAAIIHILFFVAIIRHKMAAPSTTVTMVQDTWNISVTPALISAEFMRAMQENWWEKIPNRRYCRIDPVVDLQQRSGLFQGSIVEETQPVPFVLDGVGGERPFASGDPLIINIINGYALFLTMMGSIGSYVLVDALIGGRELGSLLASTLFCWAISKAAFDVARSLTLRFDFRSQLIWMEVSGTYNAAEVGQGNRYTSNLHSSSQVVQVEGMTFRLWVADVHSVAFGKDGQRSIIAMLGEPDIAAALTRRLKSFITSQATLVAVGSVGDQERAEFSNHMNGHLNRGAANQIPDNLPPSRAG